ncbi:Integral membrane protein 2C [Basidiobolus ranarum]|uniref:Membrane protein BRI3 n=1 Tax=Basidiobolus ranarum TaxID=34480 RepID=A0ABR2WA50_9FUNG
MTSKPNDKESQQALIPQGTPPSYDQSTSVQGSPQPGVPNPLYPSLPTSYPYVAVPDQYSYQRTENFSTVPCPTYPHYIAQQAQPQQLNNNSPLYPFNVPKYHYQPLIGSNPNPASQICGAGGEHQFDKEFTLGGIFLAVFFFPLGILPCLCMTDKRCTKCGGRFD